MLAKTLLRSTARSALAPAASRAFSTAGEPLVLVEKINNYAVVRMNRPPVNSLSTAVRWDCRWRYCTLVGVVWLLPLGNSRGLCGCSSSKSWTTPSRRWRRTRAFGERSERLHTSRRAAWWWLTLVLVR